VSWRRYAVASWLTLASCAPGITYRAVVTCYPVGYRTLLCRCTSIVPYDLQMSPPSAWHYLWDAGWDADMEARRDSAYVVLREEGIHTVRCIVHIDPIRRAVGTLDLWLR
jgi:hypothetical protein